ncbi:trypsin-like cysteine/serine peptidase domain-containing protein [Camillea tinctor]|nr:trypsin-like cysteine/serine peptidase domain-containing protein [Camillea tinctor]
MNNPSSIIQDSNGDHHRRDEYLHIMLCTQVYENVVEWIFSVLAKTNVVPLRLKQLLAHKNDDLLGLSHKSVEAVRALYGSITYLINFVPLIPSQIPERGMNVAWVRLNNEPVRSSSHQVELRPIGSPNQVLVEQQRVAPNGDYGALFRLEMEFDGFKAHGTGTLIGPNMILTAGHNVYYPGGYVAGQYVLPRPAIRIIAQQGHWGTVSQSHGHENTFVGNLAAVNPAYIAQGSTAFDVAVIMLSDDVNRVVTPLSYQSYPLSSSCHKLYTLGYPYDLPYMYTRGFSRPHEEDGHFPYLSTGEKLPTSDENILHHSMATTYGNSGGPIFLDGQNAVVAIHCAGVYTSDLNEASYIGWNGNNVDAFKMTLEVVSQHEHSPNPGRVSYLQVDPTDNTGTSSPEE